MLITLMYVKVFHFLWTKFFSIYHLIKSNYIYEYIHFSQFSNRKNHKFIRNWNKKVIKMKHNMHGLHHISLCALLLSLLLLLECEMMYIRY